MAGCLWDGGDGRMGGVTMVCVMMGMDGLGWRDNGKGVCDVTGWRE